LHRREGEKNKKKRFFLDEALPENRTTDFNNFFEKSKTGDPFGPPRSI
jgi:hypothetical protein